VYLKAAVFQKLAVVLNAQVEGYYDEARHQALLVLHVSDLRAQQR
jgi:hypothetical protein